MSAVVAAGAGDANTPTHPGRHARRRNGGRFVRTPKTDPVRAQQLRAQREARRAARARGEVDPFARPPVRPSKESARIAAIKSGASAAPVNASAAAAPVGAGSGEVGERKAPAARMATAVRKAPAKSANPGQRSSALARAGTAAGNSAAAAAAVPLYQKKKFMSKRARSALRVTQMEAKRVKQEAAERHEAAQAVAHTSCEEEGAAALMALCGPPVGCASKGISSSCHGCYTIALGL